MKKSLNSRDVSFHEHTWNICNLILASRVNSVYTRRLLLMISRQQQSRREKWWQRLLELSHGCVVFHFSLSSFQLRSFSFNHSIHLYLSSAADSISFVARGNKINRKARLTHIKNLLKVYVNLFYFASEMFMYVMKSNEFVT